MAGPEAKGRQLGEYFSRRFPRTSEVFKRVLRTRQEAAPQTEIASQSPITIIPIGTSPERTRVLADRFGTINAVKVVPIQPTESTTGHLNRAVQEVPSTGNNMVVIDIAQPIQRETIMGTIQTIRTAVENNRDGNTQIILLTPSEKRSDPNVPLEKVFTVAEGDSALEERIGAAEIFQKELIEAGLSKNVDVVVSDKERDSLIDQRNGTEASTSEPLVYAAVSSVNSTEPRVDHLGRHPSRLGVELVATPDPELSLRDSIQASLQALPSDKESILMIDFAKVPVISDDVKQALQQALQERDKLQVVFVTKPVDEQQLSVGTSVSQLKNATTDTEFAQRADAMFGLQEAMPEGLRSRVHTIVSSRVLGERMNRFGNWLEQKQSAQAA